MNPLNETEVSPLVKVTAPLLPFSADKDSTIQSNHQESFDNSFIPDVELEQALPCEAKPSFKDAELTDWADDQVLIQPCNSITEDSESALCHESDDVDIFTGEQLLNGNFKKPLMLVEPFLCRGHVGVVGGASDLGKSLIFQQVAVDVTLGKRETLGHKLNTIQKAAIMVISEDNNGDIADRLKKQTAGISPHLLANLYIIHETNDLIDTLAKMVKNNPVDFIVIDCFSDAYGDDLKSTEKIRKYMAPFQKFAEENDCFILFIHHTGKRTENYAPSKNNLLSGQGLEAKARLVLEFRQDNKNTNHRQMHIVKGNYLSTELKKNHLVFELDEKSLRFDYVKTAISEKPVKCSKSSDLEAKKNYCTAVLLRNQGKNFDAIAKELGFKSKSSVTKLIKRGELSGWSSNVSDVSNVSKENAVETFD